MTAATSPSLIRVMLVEDDARVQNDIAAAIGSSPDMQLVASTGTRADGLRLLQSLPPVDVLLVDLGLPDGSGIDVIRAAHRDWPACAIMVCTRFADEAHVLQSIEAGAAGYLLKDSTAANMLQEIRSLHAGGSPISPVIARQILTRFRQLPAPPAHPVRAPEGEDRPALSVREMEVLELITKGFTAEEIARLMQVSVNTVQTYVRRVYGKLEVTSKAEAIYEARQRGIFAV